MSQELKELSLEQLVWQESLVEDLAVVVVVVVEDATDLVNHHWKMKQAHSVVPLG